MTREIMTGKSGERHVGTENDDKNGEVFFFTAHGVPPVDRSNPHVRLLRAILGYCPDCDETGFHDEHNDVSGVDE